MRRLFGHDKSTTTLCFPISFSDVTFLNRNLRIHENYQQYLVEGFSRIFSLFIDVRREKGKIAFKLNLKKINKCTIFEDEGREIPTPIDESTIKNIDTTKTKELDYCVYLVIDGVSKNIIGFYDNHFLWKMQSGELSKQMQGWPDLKARKHKHMPISDIKREALQQLLVKLLHKHARHPQEFKRDESNYYDSHKFLLQCIKKSEPHYVGHFEIEEDTSKTKGKQPAKT